MLLFGMLVALAGLWSLSPVRRALGPFESPAALLLVPASSALPGTRPCSA
jgi:hypothetical protein